MKRQKIKEKLRINLYLDMIPLGEWVQEEAKRLSLNETAFARMLMQNCYNEQHNE